ncbi:MAG: methanogenesis marker 3 protein [archaeon]|nr:methanogenesis marker 3 protein [archaeon]MCP8321575.1 methanogenesis marker 3 protein [archaeon]
MEEELRVQVDGKEVLVPKGSSIAEALNLVDIKEAGSFVAVIETMPEVAKKVKEYKIKTSKGSLFIEVNERFSDFAGEIFPSIEKLRNIWSKPKSIGFGYIPLKLKPSKSLFEYNKGDVSIGFLGFEQDRGCIILIKEKHGTIYGSPMNFPVIGKVVGGRNILYLLNEKDYIEKIEPIAYELPIERAKTEDMIFKPMKILTSLNLMLSENSIIGSELILALFQKERYFKVSDATSVYVKDSRYAGTPLSVSYDLQERKRANVTIRTKGEDISSIYIYKKTVPRSRSHLYVGDIISGMELIEVAQKEDMIPMKVSPKRANVLGMSQKEAEIYLKESGIEQVRRRDEGDEAIVVEQDPYYTLEAYKKRVVETSGVRKEDILDIKLYDELSPITVRYFRMCTSLLYNKIGKLTVFFSIPDFILFKEKHSFEKLLIPENIPKNIVNSYEIGVTNASGRFAGSIGIRLTPSDKYGPSGEKFESTNIIGYILSVHKLFKVKKEGDIIYMKEGNYI